MKIAEVGEHVMEIKTNVHWIKNEIGNINKKIDGNGQPGIMQRLLNLERRQYYYMGAIAVLCSIATYVTILIA